jgi:c-di-GMP-binding flagellar brake protein YcgR
LNSEEASSQLRRVDRAIENINAYLAIHMDDQLGATKRKHPRYQKRELISRITFTQSKFLPEDRVYTATVIDVSAGGMCILIPKNVKVSVRDRFSFSVIKSRSQAKIIGGEGKVVRVEPLEEQFSIGVMFTGVQQS